MENKTAQNENQVRVFRKNPIAWWDKNVMRFLRDKYGKDKKTFMMVRSVYLALCEIESDFNDKPVRFFTKTVGTYAGMSRQIAGKYINVLVKDGLIKKTQIKDPKTNKFTGGTEVEILDLESGKSTINPLAGYPTNGLPRQRDTLPAIKNISTSKKLNINVNENLPISKKTEKRGLSTVSDILKHYDLDKHSPPKNSFKKDKPENILKRDYLAQEIADTLGDQKSLGAFRTIAERVPESIIREYLANIKETSREGKVKKSRGALFVHMIQQYSDSHEIELGFKNGVTP